MEEKAERARSADPWLAVLGRGVRWCARVLELSRAATPAPTRAPPRPRPLLKAVITLCPEQGPASLALESWRRQALGARLPRRGSERAESWRPARASLGHEGDLLRPSAARARAHTPSFTHVGQTHKYTGPPRHTET